MYLSKYLDQPEAEKPKASEEQTTAGFVGDRLARGAVKYGVMPVAGVMQIAGDVTGIEPLAKLGKEGGEGAEMFLADREKVHASQKFQDIDSVGTAGKWAAEQLTEFVPQAGLMAVTGGLGGAAGKLGAGALIDSGIATGAQIAGKSAVKAATTNLGRALTLEEAGTLAASRLGTLGAQAANTAGSIGMETSTIYPAQKDGEKDAGKAALYGVAAGILDSAVPNYLLQKTGVTKLLPGLGSTAKEAAELTGTSALTLRQRAKDVAKIAGGAIPAEATQEGIQTVLERIGSDQQVQSDEARKNGFWNTVSSKGIKAAVHHDAWDDIIESMAAGGLIGGVMGGGASVAGHAVDALAQDGQHQSALNTEVSQQQQQVPVQSGLQNPAAPPVGQDTGVVATSSPAPVAPAVARDSAPVVPVSTGPLGNALAAGGIGQQQPVMDVSAESALLADEINNANLTPVTGAVTMGADPANFGPATMPQADELTLANRWADEQIAAGKTYLMNTRNYDKSGKALIAEWKKQTGFDSAQPAGQGIDQQQGVAANGAQSGKTSQVATSQQEGGVDHGQKGRRQEVLNENGAVSTAPASQQLTSPANHSTETETQLLSAVDNWQRQNRSGWTTELQAGEMESNNAFNGVDGWSLQAHGMSKASPAEAVRQLLKLFRDGIDTNRGGNSGVNSAEKGHLYSANLTSKKGLNAGAATGTSGGVAYRDGAFILVAREGVQTIRDMSDIAAVLVNPAMGSDVTALLQSSVPAGVMVRDYNGIADVVSHAKQQIIAEKDAQSVMPGASAPPASQTAPRNTAEEIARTMEMMGGGMAEAAHENAVDRFKKEGGLQYFKPETVAMVQQDPRYNITLNQDGSATVNGILDTRTGEWVGSSPASDQSVMPGASAPPASQTPKPKPKPSFNPAKDDLITAIAKMGGVSADQVRREAGTTLLDDRHQLKSGISHSITKNGLPLDTMREAMVEHGYLPEDATTRDLIDAMIDAAQGNPTYSNQRVVDHDAELAAYEAQQLQDMIDMGEIPFSLQALDDGSQYTEDHLKVIGQAFMGPKTKYTDWLKQMKQVLGERFAAVKKFMIKTYQELKRLYKEKAPAFVKDQKGLVQLSLFGLPDVAKKEAFELRGQRWTQNDKKPVQQGLFENQGQGARGKGQEEQELQQGGEQAGGQSVSAESAAPRKEDKQAEPVRVVEDSARGRAIAHLASVKASLEAQGYDVTTRIRQDADLKKLHTIQFEVGWKGKPLLVANRRFADNEIKLLLSAGLHTREVNGVQQKTSFGAYNDLMWAEMESLSQLDLPVNVQLEGEGSHKWFVDNMEGAEDIKRGNNVTITFSGKNAGVVVESNKELEALAQEAKNNANDWSKTTAIYDASTIEPEEYEKPASIILSKAQLNASRATREEHGRDNRLTPGWTGSGSRAEVQDNLDRVWGSLRDGRTALSEVDQGELDAAFDNWGEEPAAQPAAPEPKPAKPAKPASSLEAGEELIYNKRNRVKGVTWDDVKDSPDALKAENVKKDKVYSKPDYAALVDDGMPALIAHIVKQVYDAIPNAPVTRRTPTDADFQTYILAVNRVMDATMKWATSKEMLAAWAAKQGKAAGAMQYGSVTNVSDLIDNAKRPYDLAYPDGWRAFKDEVYILGGNKLLSRLQPGYDEIVRAGKDVDKGWPGKVASWQKQGYSIGSKDDLAIREWTDTKGEQRFAVRLKDRTLTSFDSRAEAQAFIGSKKPFLVVFKNYSIKGSFDTRQEAEAGAKKLVTKEQKTGPDERGMNVTDAERIGPERRLEGESVSAKQIMEVFGFRGINIGNWVPADEAQLHLNFIYDSLFDLAEIIGVPPKALSLNGTLGIAVGAQGGGGRASAHYVPAYKEINITRTAGAGAFVHELGHAFDNWFGEMGKWATDKKPYLSKHLDNNTNGEVRPEVVAAFKQIVQTMRKRWQTPTELAEQTKRIGESSAKSLTKYVDRMQAYFDNSSASDEVKAEASRLLERVRNKDVGDGYVAISSSKLVSPVIADLYQLAKKHKVAPKNYGKIAIDEFQWLHQAAYSAIKNAGATVQQEQHVPLRMVDTDYAKASAEADKGKPVDKLYWSTPWEMFARAFDAYITDKVAAEQRKNSYLSGLEAVAPQGEERTAINAAFDQLFATLKTKETEKGVALYSATSETGSLFTSGLGSDTITDKKISQIRGITPVSAVILRNKGLQPVEVQGETSDMLRAVAGRFGLKVIFYRAQQLDAAGNGGKQAAAGRAHSADGSGVRGTVSGSEQNAGRAEDRASIDGFIATNLGNTVFLNADSTRHLLFIIGHEVSHAMGLNRPALYQQLLDDLRPYLPESSDYKAYTKRLTALESYQGADKESLYREVVGDLMGDLFVAENVWPVLAKENPTLFKQLVNIVVKVLSAIKSMRVHTPKAQTLLIDHPNANRILLDAIKSYAENNGGMDGLTDATKEYYAAAWHGSPHDHDKFSTDKIGTGEGVQAYGWGLYFAGSKDVAEFYRDKLSGRFDNITVNGEPAGYYSKDDTAFAALNVVAAYGNVEKALDSLRDRAENSPVSGIRAKSKEAIDFLENNKIEITNPGRLYRVELAPAEDQYLLWDKPLSEQSEKVKAALESGDYNIKDYGRGLPSRLWGKEDFGEGLYERLSRDLGSYKAASEYLHSLGIRGIKYLDGNSRSGKKEDYNYVIFNDADVEIVGKFSLASSKPSGLKADALQREFANLPYSSKIKVVQSALDLPGVTDALLSKLKGKPNGMHKNGIIWLVADNLQSVEQAKAIALGHELTHAGQDKLITDHAVAWFEALQKKDPAQHGEFQQLAWRTLKHEAAKRNYDLNTKEGFRNAVKEATAVLAELAYKSGNIKNSLFTRLLMAIKHILRNKLKMDLKFTDQELVQVIAEMMRLGDKNMSLQAAAEGRLIGAQKAAIFSKNAEGYSLQQKTLDDPRHDFQERVIAAQDMRDAVRTTGQRLTINSDGSVQLFHGTSTTNAEAIQSSGIIKSQAFFAASKAATTPHAKPKHGKDTTVISLNVDPRDVEFSTGTGEFYAPDELRRGEDGIWKVNKAGSTPADDSGEFSLTSPTLDHAQQVALDLWKDASGANLLKAMAKTINPFDYSRSSQWFDRMLPESVKNALAWLFRTPVNQAAVDADKRVFVDAALEREETKIGFNLALKGWDGKTKATTFFGRVKDAVSQWENSDKSTAWGRIQDEFVKLSADQRDAVNVLLDQGDYRYTVYKTLAGAMKNKQIAMRKPTPEAFALYQKVRHHIDTVVAAEREKIFMEMAREAGLSKPEIEKHIADYRNSLAQRPGWLPRNHGQGKHQANVHHIIESLDFDVTELEGGRKKAFLPYYAGPDVTKAMERLVEEINKQYGDDQADQRLKFGTAIAGTTLLPNGQMSVVGKAADVDALMQKAEGIIPALKAKHATRLANLKEARSLASENNATKAELRRLDQQIKDMGDGTIRVKVFMSLHESKYGAEKVKERLEKDLKKEMPKNFRPGRKYDISYAFADHLDEDTYGELSGDLAMERAQLAALKKASQSGEVTREEADEMKKAIIKSTAEVLMGRGAGRHQIERAPYLIEGYATDNSMQAYTDYMDSTAGMLSKAMYAREQFDNLRYAKAEVKVWANQYINDTLRNQGWGDQASGTARSLAALWFMGFKASSVLINATQVYTLGVADLGRRTSQNSVAAILKAQKDIAAGALSADEKALFDGKIWKLQEMENAVNEMTGALDTSGSGFSKHLHIFTSKAMMPFQEMELFNRRTMLLAAYRVGLADKLSKDDALKFAVEVNRAVNFEMSRANLPGWARNPVGRTAYALQSFVFNTWNWVYDRASSGEKADMVALLKYSALVGLFGGAAALAGGDELDKLYRRIYGRSIKQELQQFTRKHLKEYGSPGDMLHAFVWHGGAGVLGVNISNSIRLNIPLSGLITGDASPTEAAMGVWSGLANKGALALKAAGKGDVYRAVEAAAPEAISGAMRAYRQYDRGVTTLSGKVVYDENGQPAKYDAADALLRMTGLQPLQQSKRTELTSHQMKLQQHWKDERTDVVDAFRIARTKEDQQAALRKIIAFNKALGASQAAGLPGLKITTETIKNAAQQRRSKADKQKTAWLQAQM